MTHVTILASPDVEKARQPVAAREFVWADESACANMAGQLAKALRPNLANGDAAYLELHGTLGAGKTTFTRHLLRALGVPGRIKSPSYAVVEPHEAEGGVNVHHFDFYRFNDPQEWEDAGFRDLFAAPGLKLAEWPEKAAGLLPRADLRIHIALPPSSGNDTDQGQGETRVVQIEAFSALGQSALAGLAAWTASEPAGVQAHG